MKQKTVWLMCGVPASGKSTFVKEQIQKGNATWCSRDHIRFSMLNSDDGYFSKEDEVWKKWIQTAQECIDDETGPDNIYLDATHLTPKARAKTLNCLNVTGHRLGCVAFNIPLEDCLRRNALRSGRAFVPDSVIKNMYKSYRRPSIYEDYFYDEIITVNR